MHHPLKEIITELHIIVRTTGFGLFTKDYLVIFTRFFPFLDI